MAERNTAWMEAALAACPSTEFQSRLRGELERRIRMIASMGVREGFTTVTPIVSTLNVNPVVEFAKRVFGAVETLRAEIGGQGVHCEIRIGESMVMVGGGPAMPPNPQVLHIYVSDVDTVYQRALDAGAESVLPVEDRPYGERLGGVKDPSGNVWYIATRLPGASALEGVRTVVPYLHHPQALEIIEFLKRGFGAEEIGVFTSPEGQLMHAALRVGDAVVELGAAPAMPVAFYLYVPDVDAVYQRVVAAGAESLSEPAEQPYGARVARVKDRWGNSWHIATHLGTR